MSFSFGPSAVAAPAPTSSFSFGSAATSQPSGTWLHQCKPNYKFNYVFTLPLLSCYAAFNFGPTTSAVAAPTFGAATSVAPAFGAATSVAAPAFGGFANAAAVSKPAALSFGGFGSTATSSSTPAFGSLGGGFGQPAAAGAGTLGGGGTFGAAGFGAGLGTGGTGLFASSQNKPFGATGTSFGLGKLNNLLCGLIMISGTDNIHLIS